MDDKIRETTEVDEANGNFDRSWRDEQWGDRKLSVAAHDFAQDEKDMTIRQALAVYRKAILWCLIISTCVIMEGYDTNLLGNFFAYRKQARYQSIPLLTRTQHLSSSSTVTM